VGFSESGRYGKTVINPTGLGQTPVISLTNETNR
jgi:hypothetical protein